MSMLKAFMMVVPLALSTAALAEPARFSDAQYIAAARCQALMSSASLGRQDTRAIDQALKANGGARTAAVFDRADEARDDAARAASHAGVYGKAGLIAERDGACRSFTGGTMTAATSPVGATRTN